MNLGDLVQLTNPYSQERVVGIYLRTEKTLLREVKNYVLLDSWGGEGIDSKRYWILEVICEAR